MAVSTLAKIPSCHEFSFIKLSEPFTSPNDSGLVPDGVRLSDASNSAVDDLFSKLRFSYLEQVTKEKFLRAILDDPPLIVEQEENAALERQLASAKSSLKAQKADVAEMLVELEAKSRELSRRYETVQQQAAEAQQLPDFIAELQAAIELLRRSSDLDVNPSQSLPLPATLSLLAEQEAAIKKLDGEIELMDSTIQKKDRELERIKAELKPLEAQRQTVEKAASEAQRRKAGLDGEGDDLEQRGRWWKGVSEGLNAMLTEDG
ncbi:MAG: hypothetical protein M1826_002664 [Phylliscum demangeonii]|nr:MAG: hypothetical protein M1826_002664 [Phylliscum demangeonii]